MASRFVSFAEFWPFYLGEHSLPATRTLHFVGSCGVLAIVAAAAVTLNPLALVAAPLCGYGFAWVSHFFIEKNRPATFTYPLWSFLGDWKMWALMLTGKLGGELERLKITPRAR
jgi:hypothetical protein